MPTIGVDRARLFAALGRSYTDAEFDELCFDFGLELDEVVHEDDGQVTYRIEIGANRHDLLCLEGLSRALKIFSGAVASAPVYRRVAPAAAMQRVVVDPSVAQVRPHCVAAVLRNVTLDQERYDSFIDLQDKLHQNLARKRTLVAIGTHDLDTVQGPFTYAALPPEQISFRALNQSAELTAPQLMQLYAADPHLKQYLPIIRDSPVYPVIRDSAGVVLSMPPIINGDRSKISLATRNVLIECTATDLTKAQVVLDTIVTAFSEYCAEPYSVEAAEVVDADGRQLGVYPTLKTRHENVSREKVCGLVGAEISGPDIAALLTRMSLPSTCDADGDAVRVTVPPTRQDVLHACDVYEDVAIAYGYNNLVKTIPRTMTIGEQQPLNKLTDQLRGLVAQCGFTEALTFSLCSRDDVGSKLGRSIDDVAAVHIGNPKTIEFQVARTSLLPGLLKTAAANKSVALPLKLFEVSDVVLADRGAEVGARNERRLAALHIAGKSPGFEAVHGLLDAVMRALEAPHAAAPNAHALEAPHAAAAAGYAIRGCDDDPAFFPGRCAEVVAYGVAVGKIGVLHPDVITKFELSLPCAAMEINIEPFL